LPLLDGLELLDVEGDGSLEIVYLDDIVHVLDGRTGQQKWQVDDVYPAASVTVGDPDRDGVRELVIGAEHTVAVVDVTTRAVEWQGLAFEGPYHGLAHGDVDGNGRPDFLYTSHASGYLGTEDGLYFVHNAQSTRLRYVSPPPTGSDHGGLRRVEVANVDADPQLEVFMATTIDSYRGLVICYDGLTHAEQWRAPLEDGLGVASLQLGDVDADGQLEAVVGSYWEHTGAPGSFVYVFDGATGGREWRSPDFAGGGGRLSLLRLAQLDDDPSLEILVADHGGVLYRLDRATGEMTGLADNVTALETVPTSGGRARIVVGGWDGTLQVLRRHAGLRVGARMRRVIGPFATRIDGLAVRDVTGDGTVDYLFVAEGRLHVVDGLARTLLWRSGWIGRAAAAHDSLRLGDIDDDGRLEVMVNTDDVGLDIYELPAP
jgi:hypothetical protein